MQAGLVFADTGKRNAAALSVLACTIFTDCAVDKNRIALATNTAPVAAGAIAGDEAVDEHRMRASNSYAAAATFLQAVIPYPGKCAGNVVLDYAITDLDIREKGRNTAASAAGGIVDYYAVYDARTTMITIYSPPSSGTQPLVMVKPCRTELSSSPLWKWKPLW